MHLREVKPLSCIYEAENALPESLCKNMVERFEAATDEQYQGHIGQTVSTTAAAIFMASIRTTPNRLGA